MQFIIVWFFIALWTLVDPAFHQRCYAAKDGATARRGILISIGFWMVFDLMTVTAGLYARAAVPDLADPAMSYFALAERVLPAGVKGLFYIGMLATMMSTLNTLAFVSAQTLGKDIAGRMTFAKFTRGGDPALTRAGLVISFAFSILLAIWIPSVISLWYTIGTLAIPGLLIPLMSSYFKPLRMTSGFAFLAMLCASAVSLLWMLAGLAGGVGEAYPLGIEPMYPGLFVGTAIWMADRRNVSRLHV